MADINQPAAQALVPVPPAPAPAPGPQPEAPGAQGRREMLAAGISIVILILAVTGFALTFAAGRAVFVKDDGKKEAYDRQRDLLGVVIGLLGTVTGYYLGRAPAELRAQTTQGLLNIATTATAQANQTAESVKQQARQASDAALAALHSQSARPPVRGMAAAPNQANLEAPDVERARQVLEELKRRL